MLIDYREIGFSQSGEQGIALRIFDLLGITKGLCCEFGAWDGIYLSNTRALMLKGWRGLMIEADPQRCEDLRKTYPHELCVCAFVDAGTNSLPNIASKAGISERFDLVSIDIDGPDFEVFEALSGFKQMPLVVCIEAHTCHAPDDTTPVPPDIAHKGAGQPLGRYVEVARRMGYRLVCFIGTNAFFAHRDAGHEADIPTLTPLEAAQQNLALIRDSKFTREYLYLCNLGKVQPFYHFNNPLFSSKSLGISTTRAASLRFIPRDGNLKPKWPLG
jgi:hypothetical protein